MSLLIRLMYPKSKASSPGPTHDDQVSPEWFLQDHMQCVPTAEQHRIKRYDCLHRMIKNRSFGFILFLTIWVTGLAGFAMISLILIRFIECTIIIQPGQNAISVLAPNHQTTLCHKVCNFHTFHKLIPAWCLNPSVYSKPLILWAKECF